MLETETSEQINPYLVSNLFTVHFQNTFDMSHIYQDNAYYFLPLSFLICLIIYPYVELILIC